jgi:chromosome partitioning protein
MLVITVANLKGGVGKTTTTVCLAEIAAEETGSAIVVDADPQGSAYRWGQIALDREQPLGSVATAHPGTDLPRYISSLAGGPVLIDTGPGRSAEDVRVMRSAMKAASLIVIPCQPSGADLDTIGPALDLIEEVDRPAVVLLTRTKAPTLARDARVALIEAGATVLETEIPDRAGLVRAYGRRPGSDVLELYRPVWAEVLTYVPAEVLR